MLFWLVNHFLHVSVPAVLGRQWWSDFDVLSKTDHAIYYDTSTYTMGDCNVIVNDHDFVNYYNVT